jgi:hypothetical protein
MCQNVNTWGNINVNVRLGTKTEKRRMEEEIFFIYSRSSLGIIFPAWLVCGISKYL